MINVCIMHHTMTGGRQTIINFDTTNIYNIKQPYISHVITQMEKMQMRITVKPVCNDHLYNKINYLWFIQLYVLMMTEGTNLLVLTISAFWSPSWPPRWAPEGREVSH